MRLSKRFRWHGLDSEFGVIRCRHGRGGLPLLSAPRSVGRCRRPALRRLHGAEPADDHNGDADEGNAGDVQHSTTEGLDSVQAKNQLKRPSTRGRMITPTSSTTSTMRAMRRAGREPPA